MNYKKSIVFLISFCLVFFGNIIYTLSCGPDPDPYDYYVSFFSPYTKGTGYEPFYYTSLSVFYGDPTPSEATSNVADWQEYAGKKVTGKDIREYIYTYKPEQFAAIASGNEELPDSVKQNSFAQFLLKGKNREAARYLLFAKTCEPAVVNSDPWSVPERNTQQLDSLYRMGEALYQETKEQDIRERYAFQLIRLQHYAKAYERAITDFDKMFDGKERNSLVYYKALALKAGAMLRLKDTVQSAYLFSRVFDKAPSQRISCFTSLMWTNTSDRQIYPLCKNNHERATVAAIFGFDNSGPSVESIRKVYAEDPASPALNILLAREINKLEEQYASPALVDSGVAFISLQSPTAENKSMTKAWIRELQGTADSIIRLGKVKDIDMWRVSSAYLSYFLHDYPAARTRLDDVKTKDTDVRDQWEIVNLLVNINQRKTIDSTFEAQLLTSFKWLDTKTPERKYSEIYWSERSMDKAFAFRKVYRNLLFAVLAPRYHQQGDETREALIRGRCDSLQMQDYFISGESAVSQVRNDMTPAALISLNNFLHKTAKTPYEAYLAGFFPKEINMDQTIGESYLRIHDFANARNWFKKVPAVNQVASYQVFRDQLQDFGEDTAEARYTKKITQLQLCERMLQLQEKMKTNPVPANVYYDYATALFGMSYYGRTWYFVKDYRPSTTWYTSGCEKDPFLKQYFGCYEAETYYLKAAQAATDKEFKARCLFMAARCSQKHTPTNQDHKLYVNALISNRYFPLLASGYSQTKFYDEVYHQCGYLQDYVKSRKK
jgi:hypothetical protein